MVRQQLEALKLDDRPRETPPGSRMILPGHLNELLELALPGQVLLVDLRTPTDFERSHIHGAANLRAPASFLRQAPLEAIEAAFVDGQSRRAFEGWQMSRCVVFYSREIESVRECLAAEALAARFAAWGWGGEVYLLKGHYREFSTSFGRHIGGARMSDEGREYLAALRRRSVLKEDVARSEEAYRAWREARAADELGSTAHSPVDEEKREAMEMREEELERSFREGFPHLYGSADDLRHGAKADDFSDAKAQMVGHLDRGLTKMREASRGAPRAPERAPGHEKATGALERRSSSAEYVEVSREGQGAEEQGQGQGQGRGRGGGLISRVLRRA